MTKPKVKPTTRATAVKAKPPVTTVEPAPVVSATVEPAPELAGRPYDFAGRPQHPATGPLLPAEMDLRPQFSRPSGLAPEVFDAEENRRARRSKSGGWGQSHLF